MMLKEQTKCKSWPSSQHSLAGWSRRCLLIERTELNRTRYEWRLGAAGSA